VYRLQGTDKNKGQFKQEAHLNNSKLRRATNASPDNKVRKKAILLVKDLKQQQTVLEYYIFKKEREKVTFKKVSD